ncbi:MAG: hypothetical protein ACTSRR_00325 [Candidatus Heimdallarchaeaceae archaeon]
MTSVFKKYKILTKIFVIIILSQFLISNLLFAVSSYTSNTEKEINTETKAEAVNYFQDSPKNEIVLTHSVPKEIIENTKHISRSEVKKTTNYSLSFNVGDSKSFYVEEGGNTISFRIAEAEVVAISEHAYYFVEIDMINEYGVNTVNNLITSEKSIFESKIYPVEYDFFGDMEGNLGNIGDGRLIILHAYLPSNYAGYFWGINEHTQEELDAQGYSYLKSNEWEMIFIGGIADYTDTLAHEFQHLIHYNHDQDEMRWFDEGCAVFSEYITGRMPGDYEGVSYWSENYFKEHSDDSLIYWNYYSEGNRDVRIDYGGAYLFVFYVYEQFGPDIIRKFVNDTRPVQESINDELKDKGETFNDFFYNWHVALLIDRPDLANGTFGFTDIIFTIEPITITYTEISSTIDVPYYGFYTFEINLLNRFMDVRINNKDKKRLGIVTLYFSKDDTLIDYEIYETTKEQFYVEPEKDVKKILFCLSYVDEDYPTVYGDPFGLGPQASVLVETLEHFKLRLDKPIISFDERTLLISDLDIIFYNQTEINDANGADFVTVTLSGEKGTYYYNLTFNEEKYAGWGGEILLKGVKGGLYSLSFDAETSNFSGNRVQNNIEYKPPIPVWVWVGGGLILMSVIGAVTFLFSKK